jgi:hypothetical protein
MALLLGCCSVVLGISWVLLGGGAERLEVYRLSRMSSADRAKASHTLDPGLAAIERDKARLDGEIAELLEELEAVVKGAASIAAEAKTVESGGAGLGLASERLASIPISAQTQISDAHAIQDKLNADYATAVRA